MTSLVCKLRAFCVCWTCHRARKLIFKYDLRQAQNFEHMDELGMFNCFSLNDSFGQHLL